jgi:hypothetical protein
MRPSKSRLPEAGGVCPPVLAGRSGITSVTTFTGSRRASGMRSLNAAKSDQSGSGRAISRPCSRLGVKEFDVCAGDSGGSASADASRARIGAPSKLDGGL